MSGSIRFDRAVDYYDRTRALPDDVQTRLTDLLVDQLDAAGGRVLEIGVGTGRIALPLAAAGLDVTGLDLSRPMLERLALNAGGAAAVRVLVGDATRLPFADATFGGAIASHVLHLIPDWQQALVELARVVRIGGSVLVARGQGWLPESVEVMTHFAEVAGLPGQPGAGTVEVVDEVAPTVGLAPRGLPPVRWAAELRLGDLVDRLGAGQFSTSWGLEAPILDRAAAATRRWLVERFGDPDPVVRGEASVTFRAYDRR